MTLESAWIYEIHHFQLKCVSIYRKEVKIIAITYWYPLLIGINYLLVSITYWYQLLIGINYLLVSITYWYQHQSMYVKWGSTMSSKFQVTTPF